MSSVTAPCLEDRAGGGVARREADAVARALPPGNGARQRRARSVKILEPSPSVGVGRTQSVVDRNADAVERLLVQVRRQEPWPPVRLRQPGERQIEHVLPDLSVGVDLDAAGRQPSGGQHERACPMGRRPGRRLGDHALDPAVRRLGSDDALADQDSSAGPAQLLRQRLEEADARHGRREGRNLEDGPLQPVLELPPNLTGLPKPEDCRETDALVSLDATRQFAHERITERRLLEPPSESERAAVLSTWQVELDRARLDSPAVGEVLGQIRGIEVLQPEADEHEAATATQVAADHGLGHDRRGLCRTERGGKQEVLLEPAPVAESRQPSLEPLDAGRDHLGREAAVRMAGVRGRELRERLRRGSPPPHR